MRRLTALIAATVFSATGNAASPAVSNTGMVDLSFVSPNPVLVGTAYGLDAIDAQPRLFGQRITASFPAGRKTIWYSCPNAPAMRAGSRITYTFQAGQRYELVCQEGKEAIIRQSNDC